MYCPRCEAEYRTGIAVCSDCGIPLVDALPPPEAEELEPGTDLGDLVPVRNVSDPALLPVLTSLLQSEDIPFFVQGENALQTIGLAQLFRGADPDNVHWTLLVPSTLLAKANEVLDARVDDTTREPGSPKE